MARGAATGHDRRGDAVELLQRLIRCQCVNDGTPDSGHEMRAVDEVRAVWDGLDLDVSVFEPHPGRGNIVARLGDGRAGAPTVLFLAHLDVVPAEPAGWTHDPFAAERVDGMVWGRGALDLHGHVATMAIALRELARSDFRPDGTLTVAFTADHELRGDLGVTWLLEHHPDLLATDVVFTETGGMPIPGPGAVSLPIAIAERGSAWFHVTVRGDVGRPYAPYGVSTALQRSAELIRRIDAYEADVVIHPFWRSFIEALGFGDAGTGMFDPPALTSALATFHPELARMLHALTHDTVSPVSLESRNEANGLPTEATLLVNVRTLPGSRSARALLDEVIGDDIDVHIEVIADSPACESPFGTAVTDQVQTLCRRWYPSSHLVPLFAPGATDARHFRRHGVPSYGFGLYSDQLNGFDGIAAYHGVDERVDEASIGLMVEFWTELARTLLGPAET